MDEKDAIFKWEQLEGRVNAVIAAHLNKGKTHRFFVYWDAEDGTAMLYMDDRPPEVFAVPR